MIWISTLEANLNLVIEDQMYLMEEIMMLEFMELIFLIRVILLPNSQLAISQMMILYGTLHDLKALDLVDGIEVVY